MIKVIFDNVYDTYGCILIAFKRINRNLVSVPHRTIWNKFYDPFMFN